ncbi:MAG: Lrp/AsnC family transcriptional regulator [Pacificimonas sp.]|jgi:Lrp/AsnC family transcriptional regulator|nr:Lrp/AsnC family transcriptional regulator [Pacificimonas sp.]
MARSAELDPIDWRILAVLQEDASLSVQAIGERVGLSANPCWRRIKRMEEAGIIARRVALVDPASIGLAMTVFVAIRTNRHDPEWLAAFSRGIAGIAEITECHRMAGDIDYMLKLRVRDMADYDRIYQRLIAEVPGLSDVTASFSMEELKATTALPGPHGAR